MRITGGIYRGRIIKCPPGEIRPAMDRMRESLFSILGDLSGCAFLDLFSGSGLVGIEAASRGAAPVHLVEMDKGKRTTIEQNISIVQTEIKLFLMPVQRFFALAKQEYGIVYADPPFPLKGKTNLAETIAQKQLVAPGGQFIIHYPVEERSSWPQRIGDLELSDERAYGRSILRFYQRDGHLDEERNDI
ncbi:MAG: 16S rRNA (guanine(966)-N(2))-methyltransferase RsmD [Spirochaetae bacterium HGW-Spirochaetae-8]|jgi:16S rRNA (guanine(966)-N(2))-methyltransferase RsmD|nr:MAG: 16S rRNA (guanine(966)-N(2))-methyltransferase RsmD [Spirochaetae bacterium HGW-Spirochaetae-8]